MGNNKNVLNIICYQANANQNHKETSHLSEWLLSNIIKKIRNSKYWRGCTGKGTQCTVGGNINWCSHYGKQHGRSSKN